MENLFSKTYLPFGCKVRRQQVPGEPGDYEGRPSHGRHFRWNATLCHVRFGTAAKNGVTANKRTRAAIGRGDTKWEMTGAASRSR